MGKIVMPKQVAEDLPVVDDAIPEQMLAQVRAASAHGHTLPFFMPPEWVETANDPQAVEAPARRRFGGRLAVLALVALLLVLLLDRIDAPEPATSMADAEPQHPAPTTVTAIDVPPKVPPAAATVQTGLPARCAANVVALGLCEPATP
jgi:hypothetical protein